MLLCMLVYSVCLEPKVPMSCPMRSNKLVFLHTCPFGPSPIGKFKHIESLRGKSDSQKDHSFSFSWNLETIQIDG